jgi:hypothetical protein
MINKTFDESGLVTVTSHQIKWDCAQLLLDLYKTGIQFELIPKNTEVDR